MLELVRSPSRRKVARTTQTGVAAILLCLGASATHADVLLASANINDQSFVSPQDSIGSAFVDLGGGITKFTFATTQANERIIITFSAGCLIYSGSGPGFAEINILVNPAGTPGEIAIPPTSRKAGGSILCEGGPSRNGVGATVVGWTMIPQPGFSSVRVRVSYGSLVGGTITAVLTGVSIAVVH